MALQQARGVQPLSLTNAERDGLTDKVVGLIIYNNELLEAQLWTGTAWITLGNVAGSLTYRGAIDATTQEPTNQPPAGGDMYINSVTGTCTAGWGSVSGGPIAEGDRIIFDGNDWATYSSNEIPDLQQVTNQGSTTTNSITAANFTTAGTTATENLSVGQHATIQGDIKHDSYVYTLPDKTGTIALTSDITPHVDAYTKAESDAKFLVKDFSIYPLLP